MALLWLLYTAIDTLSNARRNISEAELLTFVCFVCSEEQLKKAFSCLSIYGARVIYGDEELGLGGDVEKWGEGVFVVRAPKHCATFAVKCTKDAYRACSCELLSTALLPLTRPHPYLS